MKDYNRDNSIEIIDRIFKELHDLEALAFKAGYDEGFVDGKEQAIKDKKKLDKFSSLSYLMSSWIKSIKERNQ